MVKVDSEDSTSGPLESRAKRRKIEIKEEKLIRKEKRNWPLPRAVLSYYKDIFFVGIANVLKAIQLNTCHLAFGFKDNKFIYIYIYIVEEMN